MRTEARDRTIASEHDVEEQAAEVADAFLTRTVTDLVTRVDCWNKDKKGRTKCGCPSCNKREGGKVADELNRTLNLKHGGLQANEFYVDRGGKKIAYRKRERDED